MLVRVYVLVWSFKTKTNVIHVLEYTHLKTISQASTVCYMMCS